MTTVDPLAISVAKRKIIPALAATTWREASGN
jgi:hypothetical protein